MADDAKGTYDLVPEGEPEGKSTGESTSEPASEPTGEPTDAAPSGENATDAVAPGVPIEPLLDEFDDDEDLERDPEVEEALSGKKKTKKPEKTGREEPAPEADTRKALVKPGWDPPRAMFVVGGVLTTAAIVITAINTPDHRFLAPLLVLYKIAIHTGTGVVAVIAAALLLHLKTGRLDKAAARMFVAVSAFMLVVNIDLNIGAVSATVGQLLGAGAYLLLVAWLFRLGRDRLLVVTIAHLALVVVIKLGMVLSTMMAV